MLPVPTIVGFSSHLPYRFNCMLRVPIAVAFKVQVCLKEEAHLRLMNWWRMANR